MNVIMKENEVRCYRIKLSKIQMKAYIVFLLLLSEEVEHSFTGRKGITDPAFGSMKSFRMTLKKHVYNRPNIRLRSNKSTSIMTYFKVLGSVLMNNCVCGTRYCPYQFCSCLFWISIGRLKCGLCFFRLFFFNWVCHYIFLSIIWCLEDIIHTFWKNFWLTFTQCSLYCRSYSIVSKYLLLYIK